MKTAPLKSVSEVRPGMFLAMGTGFYYVTGVFTPVRKIRYRLWDETLRAWRGERDMVFPLAHLSAYEAPELARLLPPPTGR